MEIILSFGCYIEHRSYAVYSLCLSLCPLIILLEYQCVGGLFGAQRTQTEIFAIKAF